MGNPKSEVGTKLTDVDGEFNPLGSANTNVMKAIACVQSREVIKKVFNFQQSRVTRIETTESVNI